MKNFVLLWNFDWSTTSTIPVHPLFTRVLSLLLQLYRTMAQSNTEEFYCRLLLYLHHFFLKLYPTIGNMSYFSEFLKSFFTIPPTDLLLHHNAQRPGSAEQPVDGMVRVLLLFWLFWGLLFFQCGFSWLGFCGCFLSYPLAMYPAYNWTQINGLLLYSTTKKQFNVNYWIRGY